MVYVCLGNGVCTCANESEHTGGQYPPQTTLSGQTSAVDDDDDDAEDEVEDDDGNNRTKHTTLPLASRQSLALARGRDT